MKDIIDNRFDDGFDEISLNPIKIHLPSQKYADEVIGKGRSLKILLLGSDSRRKIMDALDKGFKMFVNGHLHNHQKNLSEIGNVSSDKEILVRSFKGAYNAGGKRALESILSLPEEEHEIQLACDDTGNGILAKYSNVRAREVYKRLRENRPDVFHYCGHNNDKLGLSFYSEHENLSNLTEPSENHMSNAELQSCFKKYGRKVSLAVFATCKSSDFAESLVKNHQVLVAIGTVGDVEDEDARKFVGCFYRELLSRGWQRDDGAFISSAWMAFSLARKNARLRRGDLKIFPAPAEATKKLFEENEYQRMRVLRPIKPTKPIPLNSYAIV